MLAHSEDIATLCEQEKGKKSMKRMKGKFPFLSALCFVLCDCKVDIIKLIKLHSLALSTQMCFHLLFSEHEQQIFVALNGDNNNNINISKECKLIN